MKKIMICMFLLVSALSLKANEEILTYYTTPDNKILKVATNANYQPFEYVNMSMEIIGFDIDLLKEISKRVGFDYELVEMDFDNIFAALQNGSVDIAISSIEITEKRLEAFDFSKPYFNTETLYLKRKADDNIKTKADLSGKNVGIQEGTTQEVVAKKIDGVNIHSFSTDTSLINGLKSGILDVIILDSAVAFSYLSKNLDLVDFLRESDKTSSLGMAVKKGNYSELLTKINLAIDEIMSDGTYDNLLFKYKLK